MDDVITEIHRRITAQADRIEELSETVSILKTRFDELAEQVSKLDSLLLDAEIKIFKREQKEATDDTQ